MTQYIDKAAVVAEIKRRRDFIFKRNPYLINSEYCIEEDNAILNFLDTLEVKDVDLENETQKILDKHFFYPEEDDELKETPKLARYIAKHFFQLGLNTQKGD